MSKRKKKILSQANPVLAKEWHPTKNLELTPHKITTGSGKKVWWRCKKGHEWQTSVSSRNRGSGCPDCRRNRVSPGYNLAVVNPDLAKEWHPTKNKSLKPVNIAPGSSKKVWWLCKYSHEWQAAVLSRKNGSG